MLQGSNHYHLHFTNQAIKSLHRSNVLCLASYSLDFLEYPDTALLELG